MVTSDTTLPLANPNANYFNAGQGGNPTGTTVAPAINTAQPSPTTVQVQPPTSQVTTGTPSPYTGTSIVDALKQGNQASDFNSRAALAVKNGIANYTGTADQNTQLLQKYEQGLQTAQSSNQPVPQSAGEASGKVQDITSQSGQSIQDAQQQQALSDQAKALNDKMNNDPGLTQLFQDQKDYLSSQNQTESLQKEYTDMTAAAGIPALNTQLVNMKTIMDGTEDDIRNEITKSGGFATESQVMSLTAARNKTMVANYNNLLQTRDDAVNQINTAMGFAKDDAASAQALASEKMNFDQQVIGYEQKMTQNAQDALTSMQKTEGWDGIYKAALASGDPQAVRRINATMGNGFDIASMAKADAATRVQQIQQQAQATAQVNATLAKTNAETASANASTKKTNAETANLPVTPAATTSMPYNSSYGNGFAGQQNYVNAVLSKQGISYNSVASNTPKGTISAIDNQTGQTVIIDAKDWNATSGAIRPQYTVIYNNLK